MAGPETIAVEVIYALPQSQELIALSLPAGRLSAISSCDCGSA